MSVETWMEDGVLYIKVSGRFDFSVHNQFREAIKLAEGDVKRIMVDLAATEYLDSSALGMLLVLRDKVSGNKEAITIVNARNEVKKILEIANFGKLFTVN